MNPSNPQQDVNPKLMANRPPAALDEAQAKRNENWSKKAPQYHQNWFAADAEDQLYRELEAQILIEHVGAGPAKQLLDVCCGTGRNTLALAATGAKVWGVDGAEGMLATAKDNAVQAGYDINFVQGDARALPFEDGQFDGVVGTRFMYMVSGEDKRKVVSEFARVVRPGGKIALHFNNGLWGTKNELAEIFFGRKPRFRDRYLWPGQVKHLFQGLHVDGVVGVKFFRLALLSCVVGKKNALAFNRMLRVPGFAYLSGYVLVLATKE